MTTRLVVAGVLIVGSPQSVLSQLTPAGGEFIVNTRATGSQLWPSVCATDESHFVVAWQEGYGSFYTKADGPDGSECGVIARDLGGVPPSGPLEYVVNSYTTGYQGRARTACLDDGGFVVAWTESEEDYWYAFPQEGRRGVVARRYDATGVPAQEIPLEIEDGPQRFQDPPEKASVCRGPGGGFVTVWNSDRRTVVRRFDAASSVAGDDVVLSLLEHPECCGHEDGFVVVGSRDEAAAAHEVVARRFSADGALAGGLIAVNTYTTGSQYGPDIACNDVGRFVVVWQSRSDDDDRVLGQRFAPRGAREGTEFEVASATTHQLSPPDVAIDADGRFVVAWSAYSYYPSFLRAYARSFDAEARPLDDARALDGRFDRSSSGPSVAMDAEAGVVIAWHAAATRGKTDIFARRYSLGGGVPVAQCGDPAGLAVASVGAPPMGDAITASDALVTLQSAVGAETCPACVCDVNDNGAITATDALLVLNYVVGQPVSLQCPAC